MERQEFNDRFWNHYSPEVRALRDIVAPPSEPGEAFLLYEKQRFDKAVEISRKGVILCPEIHGLLWDPFLVISLGLQRGQTWLPSMLQPEIRAMNVGYGAAPDGSFRLSLDAADYPAWKDPNAPVIPAIPAGSPVGSIINGAVYRSTADDSDEKYANGATFKDARGTFRKQIDTFPPTPFFVSGRQVTWVKVG